MKGNKAVIFKLENIQNMNELLNNKDPYNSNKVGFNSYTEIINGRIAMIAIIIWILAELFLKQSLLKVIFGV